jgi:hypothetical protein
VLEVLLTVVLVVALYLWLTNGGPVAIGQYLADQFTSAQESP